MGFEKNQVLRESDLLLLVTFVRVLEYVIICIVQINDKIEQNAFRKRPPEEIGSNFLQEKLFCRFNNAECSF